MIKSQTFDIGRLAIDSTAIGIQPLRVDLPRLVDTRMLIQANSGGGKSWLLRLLAERASDKVQIIILDPEGEFATLREKIDIALVGHGGDIATDVRSAALLARKVIEKHISIIVDLYDLKLPDRRKYVRLFLESLMSVPRDQWHQVLIILDESHIFAPERSAGESEATGAVISLMSQGRKRGFAGILSTQRLSKLHKDAAAEANNVVIGRTWLDVDQQRAGDLLGMNKTDRQALRDMAPGEFFAFGPSLNINGVVRFRSDRVSTTHPKAGERHMLEVPQSSAAIRDIVAQIGDLPKQAEEEARTLDDAQRKIVELERQMRARPVQVEPTVKTIEVPVIPKGDMERLSAAVDAIKRFGANLEEMGGRLGSVGESVTVAAAQIEFAAQSVKSKPGAAPAPRKLSSPYPVAIPAQARTVQASGNGLPKAEKMILTALAQYHAGRNKRQIAILSGYAVNGGGFSNALSRCRSNGWLTQSGETFTITGDGFEMLGKWEPLPTGRDLVAYYIAQRPRAERSIIAVLADIYPRSIDIEQLAREAGYKPKTGGFNNALSRLRTLCLVEGRKEVRATADLMGDE